MLLHPSVRRDDGLTTITEHLTARCRRRAGGALWPLESSRWRQVQIGKRREKCLSAASCFPFPICACRRREPSKRATTQRPPSFAYFSWRSKKSERLPGRPRQTKVDRRKNRLSNNNTLHSNKRNKAAPHQSTKPGKALIGFKRDSTITGAASTPNTKHNPASPQ